MFLNRAQDEQRTTTSISCERRCKYIEIENNSHEWKKRRKQNWYRVGMKNESNDFDGSFATHLQALQLAALGFEEIGAELKNWYKANCIVSLPSACFMTWFRWMAWIDDDRLERVNEWEMGERTYRGTCNLNWLASKVSIFAFIRPNVCLPTSCLLGDCKCTVVSVSLADSIRCYDPLTFGFIIIVALKAKQHTAVTGTATISAQIS